MFISTIQRLYQTDIIRKAFFKLKKGENTFKVQDIKKQNQRIKCCLFTYLFIRCLNWAITDLLTKCFIRDLYSTRSLPSAPRKTPGVLKYSTNESETEKNG